MLHPGVLSWPKGVYNPAGRAGNNPADPAGRVRETTRNSKVVVRRPSEDLGESEEPAARAGDDQPLGRMTGSQPLPSPGPAARPETSRRHLQRWTVAEADPTLAVTTACG